MSWSFERAEGGTAPGWSPRYYPEVDWEYRAMGWIVLPLWRGSKKPPPKGFTGRAAVLPCEEDYQLWCQDFPYGNTAIRAGETVLGIDVDAYDAKQGAVTRAALEEQLGPLPATYTSGSRGDGVSGIAWYRVPPGLAWQDVLTVRHEDGTVTADIDLISHFNTYAVVWPSRHPDGRTYQWWDHDGRPCAIPSVEALTALPEAWVAFCSKGPDQANSRSRPASAEAAAFPRNLGALSAGRMCPVTQRTLHAFLTALTEGSRHQALLGPLLQLLRVARHSHTGLEQALDQAKDAFLAAVERADAPQEWERALTSAWEQVMHCVPDKDMPCNCEVATFRHYLNQTDCFTRGIGGVNERDILRRLVDLMEFKGSRRVRISQRELAEKVQRRQPAVWRNIKALEAKGWFSITHGRPGKPDLYELSLPKACLLVSVTYERMGTNEPLVPMEHLVPSTSLEPAGSWTDNTILHYAFARHGLGRGAAETLTWTYRLAASDGTVTVAQLAAAARKHSSTVRTHLKELERAGLMQRVSSRLWRALSKDPDKLAVELGIEDRRPELQAQHRLDRMRHALRRAKNQPTEIAVVLTDTEAAIVHLVTGEILWQAQDPRERHHFECEVPEQDDDRGG